MRHQASGTDGAPRIFPVFPLPNTVFFPGTSLPLHIFEPRYRAMVRDVTAREGLIVVSLMAGEDFCDLGTVGRVCDLEPLEDGRFNLRLEGLERVSLAEVPGNTAYRQVRVEARPERAGTADASVIAEARLELLATCGMLRSMILNNEPFVLHEDLPFEIVVNTGGSVKTFEMTIEGNTQTIGLYYLKKSFKPGAPGKKAFKN